MLLNKKSFVIQKWLDKHRQICLGKISKVLNTTIF